MLALFRGKDGRLHGGAGARAAGVERDAIVADFLSSNQAVPQLRDRILEAVRQRSDVEVTPELMAFTEARLSDEVLGVREEYLDTARRTIDENFGSLDGYLRSAGITEGDVTGCAARCWLR